MLGIVPASAASTKKQRGRRPQVHRNNQRQQHDDAERRDDGQHATLATPINLFRDARAEQRIGQGKRTGDCTGQPVNAGLLHQHGDDADADHCLWQSGNRAREDQPGRAGCRYQLAIVISHDSSIP